MRIAAGIVVVVMAAVWFVRKESQAHQSAASYAKEDTYDDPKIAFEETKKALMMIVVKASGSAEQQAKKIKALQRRTGRNSKDFHE